MKNISVKMKTKLSMCVFVCKQAVRSSISYMHTIAHLCAMQGAEFIMYMQEHTCILCVHGVLH